MSTNFSGNWHPVITYTKHDAITIVYDRTDWDREQCESWLDEQIAAGNLPPEIGGDNIELRLLGKVRAALDEEQITDEEIEQFRTGFIQLIRSALEPESEHPESGATPRARKPVKKEQLRHWIELHLSLGEREGVLLAEQELGGKVPRGRYREIRREIAKEQGFELKTGRR